jgi:DNA-directed RNA polymerase specialized sigma24 family protein
MTNPYRDDRRIGGRKGRPVYPLHLDTLHQLGQLFTEALPEILRYVGMAQRGVMCQADRDDRRAVLLARAWQSFLALARRGEPILPVLRQIAWSAALSSLSGKSFAGGFSARDPMSPLCKFRHGITWKALDSLAAEYARRLQADGAGERQACACLEALRDRKGANPADRAEVKIDFLHLLSSRPAKLRTLLLFLSEGYSTQEAARVFRLSPSRISQIRRAFMEAWQAL